MGKFYPIILHIKNFYKKFREGDISFFELIKNEILKDHKLLQFEIPVELRNDPDISVLISANKYNI